jgi:hypothetical protein
MTKHQAVRELSLREKILEIVKQIGYDCNGQSPKISDEEGTTAILSTVLAEVMGLLPQKQDNADYVSMYNYDYVEDGNLDDLCAYVAGKSSSWGFNNAIDEFEEIITKLKEQPTKEELSQ